MSSVIETRATLGAEFIKGLTAKVYDIQNQVDQAYSLEINSALGTEKNKFTSLFKTLKSDKARETIISKTGLGYATQTAEGADFASDSRIGGYKTEFDFSYLKTNGVTITLLDQKDRLVDTRLSELRDLMVSAKMTQDKDAFDLFNKSFTAQASLSNDKHLTFYSDGVPLCSTLHPYADGSGTTQSNASTTSLPLNEVNLEIARTALRRQVDDRGMPSNIGSGRMILLVPDALEKQAVIITKGEKRSNTANNDINIYDGICTVISSKWINSQNGGSDTAWFLIDPLKSPLVFFKRDDITSSVYRTDSNKNVTTDFYMRYQIGNKDFRGVWGSKGDGSSYTS